jgi:hypothetical protein
MRRLVGLLVVAALVATAVALAAASTGAAPATAPAHKLSPIFSLTPQRPQKPRQAPSITIPQSSGYSCAVAAGSPCSQTPCHVFVAPGPAGAVQVVPGLRSCTGATSPRAVPIVAR